MLIQFDSYMSIGEAEMRNIFISKLIVTFSFCA